MHKIEYVIDPIIGLLTKDKERIENFGQHWTSRKKLEKRDCDENEQNRNEKEVGRILKKSRLLDPETSSRSKTNKQTLCTYIIKTFLLFQVLGPKSKKKIMILDEIRDTLYVSKLQKFHNLNHQCT